MSDTTNTAKAPVENVGGPTDPDAQALTAAIKARNLIPGIGDTLLDATQAGAVVYPVPVTRGGRNEWGITKEPPGGPQGSCRIAKETVEKLSIAICDARFITLRDGAYRLVKRPSNGHFWAVLEAASLGNDIEDEPTPPAVSMR